MLLGDLDCHCATVLNDTLLRENFGLISIIGSGEHRRPLIFVFLSEVLDAQEDDQKGEEEDKNGDGDG